jgi:hypothetical protein
LGVQDGWYNTDFEWIHRRIATKWRLEVAIFNALKMSVDAVFQGFQQTRVDGIELCPFDTFYRCAVLRQSKPQNPYTMDNVFKFMGGFFTSLTQLLIGFAALAVVTEVVFGAEMFPGMTVVDNLTSLITTLGNGGFVGLVALLILWNILTKK